MRTTNRKETIENAGLLTHPTQRAKTRFDRGVMRIAQGFNELRVRLSLLLTAALLDSEFEQLPQALPLYRK